MCTGSAVNVYWECSEYVLGVQRMSTGSAVNVYWECSECVLGCTNSL